MKDLGLFLADIDSIINDVDLPFKIRKMADILKKKVMSGENLHPKLPKIKTL